ncbi:MAG: hypothetical protein JXR60_07945 [Bacteroidales bacterium]|nr:hypothetical protein [Bacteroidales bacterium]
MTVEEFDLLRKSGSNYYLIDVREIDEVEICKIEPYHHIPMMEIPQHLDRFPKDIPIVIMCHLGIRSQMTYRYLAEKGFTNIHDLLGGIDQWAKQIDPKMAKY